jgi:hypothetical protein
MCQRVDREKALRMEGLGRQSWLRPAGEEGLVGPAGPKAEWAGKGSGAESEEERLLN